MTDETICRRCSVIRVNTLCRLYDEGFRENDRHSRDRLKSLAEISLDRGYADGMKVLFPSLSPDQVRRICWNISSLLKDQDFLQKGVPLNGRRRSS